MADVIQLKENNIKRFEIIDAEGNDTGNYLEFDMEDIEFPLKASECAEEHKKNLSYISNQFIIIDKRPDKKGKKLLSYNEEEKLNVMKEFYKREQEALDLILGEGGTRKLLNGRKPYFTMYDDINDMLEPILPELKKSVDSINDKIRNKYSKENKENVIE